MHMLWEEGDRIFTRRFEKTAFDHCSYVFEIFRRNPDPFIDTKRVMYRTDDREYWELYYRIEGCCRFSHWLKRYMRHNQLEIRGYLWIMYLVLHAMEAAEERMIMTASFEISTETIMYHEGEERVKFLYVPVQEFEKKQAANRWKSCSVPHLLLELLDEVQRWDPFFSDRWPQLQHTYENWKERNAGRNFCMKQIRSWLREFPEEHQEHRIVDNNHYSKDRMFSK